MCIISNSHQVKCLATQTRSQFPLIRSRETRETELHRVLAHVRLPLLSPYFLHDCVERESAILQSKECLRLVEEAKLFHLLPDRRNSFNSERTRPRTKAGLLNVGHTRYMYYS